ncbi:hypothetical protein [Streptomyces sp. NBC_00272]|uniref:hypothetical protein n=2 Tax=unclassified Streptomyces TaxID=2593676 RepID=UPI002E28D6B7|nr:hypothetical protein [Streptomyces sp. NBC_00272]
MHMRELLEQIETRQAAARDLADRLREQITQFAAQLAEAERRLERLEIARETLLEIAQDTDTGDLDPLPSAYSQILVLFKALRSGSYGRGTSSSA